VTAALTFHCSAMPTAPASTSPTARRCLSICLSIDDPWGWRIDLPAELKSDPPAAKRDYCDVICLVHLDDDHRSGPATSLGWNASSSTSAKDTSRFASYWFRDGKPVLELHTGPSIPLVRIADKAAA
jgi:hypothetical protein